MVIFVAYNNKSTSGKLFLIFAAEYLYLCISFDIVDFSNISTCKQIFI